MDIPQYHNLFNPTLNALRTLGGSGSIQEIAETVIRQLALPDDTVQELHGEGPQTELEYRLAWSRTYLKVYGSLSNSQRGIWALTEQGSRQPPVDPVVVTKFLRDQRKRSNELSSFGSTDSDLPGLASETSIDEPLPEAPGENENSWRGTLLNLLQKMPSAGFERLCQRLLRESGFIDVEVTGRSGDGGIDGRGIIRFAGLIGFPVLFQCKRYSGSVTPSQIRDFRAQ